MLHIHPYPDCQTGRTTVPGKIFELLALPTHVLALVPPGSETEQIVIDAGASTVAPFEATAQVTSAMESIVAGHLSGRLATERPWPALDIYDRRAIASAFADCLDSAHLPSRADSSGRKAR